MSLGPKGHLFLR